MKKILLVIITAITVMFCIVIAIVLKPENKDRLSQEEIAKLRVQYPVNDNVPEHIEILSLSLEEYIRNCNVYVEAEVVSEPITYTKTITVDPDSAEGEVHDKGGGRTEFTWIKYEIKIHNDILNSIQQENVYVSYNYDFHSGMPSMEVGSRFLIGGVFNEDTETLDIGSETMFYVTEDDYVLSVKSEETKNRHTGSKVDEMIAYIKAVKNE